MRRSLPTAVSKRRNGRQGPQKESPSWGLGAWSWGFQFGMERNIHTHATCQPDFNGFQN